MDAAPRRTRTGDVFHSNIFGFNCKEEEAPARFDLFLGNILTTDYAGDHKYYICCPNCVCYTVESAGGDALYSDLMQFFKNKHVTKLDVWLHAVIESSIHGKLISRANQRIDDLTTKVNELEKQLYTVNSNVEYLLGLEVNRERDAAHKKPKV